MFFLHSDPVTTIKSNINELGSGDKKKIGNALVQLFNLATEKANRTVIRESGGIIQLIAVLQSNEPAFQINTLKIFQHLAADELSKSVIRNANGVQILINLLNNSDPQIIRNTLRTLAELCEGDSLSQNALRNHGGLQKLVNLLNSSSSELIILALQTMSYSMETPFNPTNRDAVRELGAIPKIDQLLLNPNKMIRETAIGAIVCLMRDNVNNTNYIKQINCIGKFLSLLQDESGLTKERAALAIAFLAKDCQITQNFIRENQGIKILMGILNSTNVGSKENAELIEFILYALRNLSENNIANTDAIRDANGLKMLVVLLQRLTDLDTLHILLQTLRLLTENPKNNERICQVGAVPHLIALLGAKKSELVIESTIILKNLARNVNNQPIIRDNNGLTPLIKLLEHSDITVKRWAACALANLSFDSCEVAKLGGLPLLIALLDNSDQNVLEESVGALANLITNIFRKKEHTKHQNLITEPRFVKKLISLLSIPSTDLRINCIRLLGEMYRNKFDCECLIRSNGGIEKIAALLLGSDTEVKQKAVAALCSMNLGRQELEKIIDLNVLPLLQIINTEDARSLLSRCQSVLEDRKRVLSEKSAIPAIQKPEKIDTTLPTAVTSNPPLAREKTALLAASMQNLTVSSATESPSIQLIRLADLTIDKTDKLGEGSFGVVYKAKWQTVTVAVKELHPASLHAEALRDFKEEAERHGLLRHPNIVMLFGYTMESGRYGMVMEFMTQGSLYHFLHNKKDIPWLLKLSIAQNIASGLYYLHQQNIIHRDLKSLNVLLNNDSQAKLSDFGLATVKGTISSTTTTVKSSQAPGTLRWMAPELFKRGAKCNKQTDIYALGWVLWEIITGLVPFENEAAVDAVLIQWITSGERGDIPEKTHPRYSALLTRCWSGRNEERPNIDFVATELTQMSV